MKRGTPRKILQMLILLVVAVVMFAATTTVSFALEVDKECYLTGDTNNDGVFDERDAHHALFTALLPEMYSIERDWDINKDQKMDEHDAVALLYAYLLEEIYPEYAHAWDKVHDYYDPAWNWQDNEGVVSATVTVQCACGDSHTLDAAVTLGQKTEPTCTQTGSQVYEATVSYEGETFRDTYAQTLPAAGHTEGEHGYDENQHYVLCGSCNQQIQAASHQWQADGEPTAATCQVAAVQNYRCDCGATKQTELGKAECDYVYLEGRDVAVVGEDCRFAKQYQCSVCGDIKETDYYTKHDFIAVIRQEANCTHTGLKEYVCTVCSVVDEIKTEILDVAADKHTWNDGETVSGVTTYTCTQEGCGATKKSVTAQSGAVSKDALDQADELKLDEGTSVVLGDAVKEDLGVQENIQITVAPVEQGTLDALLSAEQKEQIKDITVYDFNMTVDGTQRTSFAEAITITLPYTLQEGEDADAISVWFIGDDGKLENISATYSEGFVTFQTKHFSYYTVTRLTPAERCGIYGHIETTVIQAPTCSAVGYTKQVCQRCHAELSSEEIPFVGHNYQEISRTEATCESFGAVVEQCEYCLHIRSQVTAALGHDMHMVNTVNATCTSAGYYEYACQRTGCAHSYQEAIAQLTHDYQKDDSATVLATCAAGGYDVYVCTHCSDWVKRNETVALGHDYSGGTAQWNCDDGQDPTVTLTCGNSGCTAEKVLKANVFVKAASCLTGGNVEAIVSYNNVIYRQVLSTEEALGHQPGTTWMVTDGIHYHLCQNCGAKVDEATHNYDEGVIIEEPTCVAPGKKVCACKVCGHTKEETVASAGKHTYGDSVVTKEPTCGEAGSRTYTCTVCQETVTEPIAATGKHSYQDGVCSVCGRNESQCNHEDISTTLVDLSAYGICKDARLYQESCECGAYRRLWFENYTCEFAFYEEEGEYSASQTAVCVRCGLIVEFGYLAEFTEEPCLAQYVEWGKVTFDGNVITEYVYRPEGEYEEHPAVLPVGESILVEAEGFCGMTLVYRQCPCGDAHSYYVEENCRWTNENGVVTCAVCGTVWAYDEESVKGENCQYTTTYTYTYRNKNGELIYSYDETYIGTEHRVEIQKIELQGDSCEDGVEVWYSCKDCGETYSRYWEGDHPTVLETRTDLTGENICADAHIQYTCPCGKHAEEYLEGEDCRWYPVSGNDETGEETWRCEKCGATRTKVSEKGPMNDRCEYLYTEQATYQDADGKLLVTGNRSWVNTDHNYETSWELLGESCEDGVIVSVICTRCGESDVYETNGHEIFERTEIDLSEYGLCGGMVYAYSCPCGEDSGFDYENWGCEWRWNEALSGENYSVYQCRNCGGTWTEESVRGEQLANCRYEVTVVNTFAVEGKEPLVFVRTGIGVEHDWQETVELLGSSCEDGVRIERRCTKCGQSDFWETNYHERLQVEECDLSQYGMCGDVLRVEHCACGQESIIDWVALNCKWEFVEEGYGYCVHRCAVCQVYEKYAETVGEKVGACGREYIYTYTYYLEDGTVLFTVSSNRVETSHRNIYELTLMEGATSCEEGYWIKRICLDCGEKSEWEDWSHHATYIVQRETISQGQLCGDVDRVTRVCACGQVTETDLDWLGGECWFDYVGYDDDLKCNICVCNRCGVERREFLSKKQVEGSTCQYEESTTYVFLIDGQELFSQTFVNVIYDHNEVAKLTLLGESCDEGYTVRWECAKCGESTGEEEVRYGCSTYHVVEEILVPAEAGLCGELRWVESSCACGKLQDAYKSWYNGHCDFRGVYDENTGMWINQCIKCGAQEVSERTETKAEGAICDYLVTEKYTYLRDGQESCTFQITRKTQVHKEVAVYQLLGETCDDGYTVQWRCVLCGNVEGTDTVYTGCSWRVTEMEILIPAGENVCGEIVYKADGCACGRLSSQWMDYSCSFYRTENTEVEEYRCSHCGITYVDRDTSIKTPDTCETVVILDRTYTTADGVTGSVYKQYVVKEHVTVFEFTGNCQDGYYKTGKCAYCGDVIYQDAEVYFGHERHRVEYYNLEDFGACGGTVARYRCACGEDESWEYGVWCNYVHTGETNEDGAWEYYCEDCNSRFYIKLNSTEHKIECYEENAFYFRLVRDEEILLDLQKTYRRAFHTWLAVGFDGNCAEGVTVYQQCMYCQKQQTAWSSDPHTGYMVNYVKLENLGCCGGYLEIYSCACGENIWYDSSYSCSFTWESDSWDLENGGRAGYERQTCKSCGLVVYTEWQDVATGESCRYDRMYTRTVMKDGTVLAQYSYWHSTEIHNYKTTCTLLEGAESCTDGVLCSSICVNCGKSDSWTENHHSIYVAETWDLTEFGSVCGGTLVRYQCACGMDNYCEIANDCQCDLETKSVELGIENAINRSQYTTEGWTGKYSNAYVYTCAQTDPQCSLKIRKEIYWLAEGCRATRYEVWLLGYNEQTGEYLEKIYIESKDSETWHDYEEQYDSESLGQDDWINLYTYTCKVCGSYYTERYEHIDNTMVCWEREAVNKLDNGENQRRYEVEEYAVFNGRGFNTLWRVETTDAVGQVYWEQNVYTYDFADGACVTQRTWSDSNGNCQTEIHEHYNRYWYSEWIRQPSCSQPGIWVEGERCSTCGQMLSRTETFKNNRGHDWVLQADGEGYYCIDCGLENANGADGIIILEDMCDVYGTGMLYVVGYWNQSEEAFSVEISAVLADGTEILLKDLPIIYRTIEADGIQALTVDAEALDAAVQETAPGTEDYDVRFIFVPDNGSVAWDYAITMDKMAV